MITNIDILKKDLIRIENIKSFLVDIPKLHPDNPKYIQLWTNYTKWCIEGFWAWDNGGWRFMPPTLFFYGNFFKIRHTEKNSKVRKFIKPIIRDLNWKIHYAFIEAQGFSGWKNDNKYSGDEALTNPELYLELESSHIASDRIRFNDLHNDLGKRKEYLNPRELLKRVHENNLGRPLYYNQAQNEQIFGCRGGGKSYDVAGITAHCLTFDGIKEFTIESFSNPPTAEIAIGAAITDKSSELIRKVTDGLGFLGTDSDLGVWGTSKDTEFEPNPFYRTWKGDVKPGNKKNPYRYEYDVQTQTGWTTEGTKTALYHINYSDKKQDGDQAAAGGRYNICIYEEVGLMPNFIDALLSNVGTVSVDGDQFGVQIALGTSGNIELVQQSKKVFNGPRQYNFLAFENIYEDDENAREIGLFIPVYLSDLRFKDQNGNTDIERALKFYMNRRIEAASKNDPEILRVEKMNNPIVPSDMWISNKGSYFPVMELTERERDLLKDNLYRSIGKPVDLMWDSTKFMQVRTELNQTKEPFYEFPFTRSMSSIEGCPVIFHEPITIGGKIPDDMYLFTLDPYVSDNIDEGGSVGAFYGYLNPKYWKQGYRQTIVCSYIGKNINGKDGFYEICEKLIQYYGNCSRSFWYEANRDSVKDFFLKKNKLYLLALEPLRSTGANVYAKKVQKYGFTVSTRVDKIEMIDDASETLLIICWDNIRFVETLPCIFLVRQLMQFNLDGNFDAVSSFLGYSIAIKEIEHINLNEISNKNKHNPLRALSMNVNIFKTDELSRLQEKFRKTT